MKAKTRNRIGAVALVAVLVLLLGAVLKLYGFFDAKKTNPNNLVSIDAVGKTNYAVGGTGNLGHGWSLSVGDLGELKLRGKATADSEYIITDLVDVKTDGDYVLTSGLSRASQEGVCIYLTDGTHNYYGDFGGKFHLIGGQLYTLVLRVCEDQTVYQTIRPVLVKGSSAGSFYA